MRSASSSPRADGTADAYESAARRLAAQVGSGLLAPDDDPALYVYEMQPTDGGPTRGLLGAIELRDPADGVILPHENTMAGPVADRLALMTATEANLEPIYLVYDGGVSRRSSSATSTAPSRSRRPQPPMARSIAYGSWLTWNSTPPSQRTSAPPRPDSGRPPPLRHLPRAAAQPARRTAAPARGIAG